MGQGGGAPKRVNPLMWAFPASRSTLLEERDTARKDSRKKATFLSFRLNVPALDEEVALLTPDEWEHVLSRDAPDGEGLPIVGVDIGGGRAWSAAVGVWESGRVEALAIAPRGARHRRAGETRPRAGRDVPPTGNGGLPPAGGRPAGSSGVHAGRRHQRALGGRCVRRV